MLGAKVMLKCFANFFFFSAILFFCMVHNAVASGGATGNELLEDCSYALELDKENQSSENFLKGGYCLGYINGVASTHEMLAALLKYNKEKKTYSPILWCLPRNPSIPVGQVARIFVKYLKENPAELHRDGSVLLSAALINAFPCKEQSS